MTKDDLERSGKIANIVHQEALKVLKFLRCEIAKPLENADCPTPRSAAVESLFYKAFAWMISTEKWTNAVHYQSIAAGTRSLLEIAADLVHLHHDHGDVVTRMRNWTDSAKLKSAEAIVRYYKEKRKITIPLRYQDAESFIAGHRHEIIEQREALGWVKIENGIKKTFHPDRWSNSGLLDDLRSADGYEPSLIDNHFGMPLEEFYETEYREICWNVHGLGSGQCLGNRCPYFQLHGSLRNIMEYESCDAMRASYISRTRRRWYDTAKRGCDRSSIQVCGFSRYATYLFRALDRGCLTPSKLAEATMKDTVFVQ